MVNEEGMSKSGTQKRDQGLRSRFEVHDHIWNYRSRWGCSGNLHPLSILPLEMPNFYLFIFKLYFVFYFFYQSIVDLQCCVNFCCTARWPCHTHTYTYEYIYIHSFLILSSIIFSLKIDANLLGMVERTQWNIREAYSAKRVTIVKQPRGEMRVTFWGGQYWMSRISLVSW